MAAGKAKKVIQLRKYNTVLRLYSKNTLENWLIPDFRLKYKQNGTFTIL